MNIETCLVEAPGNSCGKILLAVPGFFNLVTTITA